MLAKGNGLFRVDGGKRTASERKILAEHPWRARLLACLGQARDYEADWVYFRLECDAGGPKPEIFIYDRTSTLADGLPPEHVARLHHELWNYGKVPLAFFLRPTGVEIINVLEPPVIEPEGTLASPMQLDFLPFNAADVLAAAGASARGIARQQQGNWDRFSSRYFDNGTFWEMPENRELGDAEKGSLASMVREMRTVRDKLERDFTKHGWLKGKDADLAGGLIRRLLIITLMVRFMEDREIIPPGYFTSKEHVDATDFKSLLRHRTALLIALDRLARDFNGDVFSLEDSLEEGDVPARRLLQSIPDEALHLIADFAEGKLAGEQRLFWQRYSFRHLPVEAISYVYEDFLGGRSQAYFTPHHLVDLLLDESMAPDCVLAALKGNDPRKPDSPPAFPVCDPSCGSGVFLVGAWHRLVETLHLLDDSPSPETLKKLMVDNIFGVDIERDSVELSIFSLCVALSSAFPRKAGEPNFIFDELRRLKFPNLKPDPAAKRAGNVLKNDFFAARGDLLASPIRFQLIIGNPPFASELKPGPQTVLDATTVDETGKQWQPVPDDNICYLFLRAVPPLLVEGGTACLVQNAGFLYNEKAAELRKALFTNWHVPEILDFASLSGLFKTRKENKTKSGDSEAKVGVKTVAVFIKRQEPDIDKPLLHVTFRRTTTLGQREVFEVDPQDLHWIRREVATSEPRVWKADLLGGGRLLETYKSLTADGTVGQYIRAMKTKGWVCSEGFIAADVDSYGDAAAGEKKKRYQPQHRPLYSKMDVLETEGLTDAGIDESRIGTCGLEWFLWPRDDQLYKPPHLLIKEHEDLPMAFRASGSDLLFRHEIVGVAAPASQLKELTEFTEKLAVLRQHFPFFGAFGPRYLTGRQTAVLKKDIMDLPYSREGKLVFRGVQKHLRDDVINFMIPLIKDNEGTRAGLSRDAEIKEVEGYAEVFVGVMKSAYPDLRFVVKHDLGRAWCLAFHRGEGKAAAFGDTSALMEHLDGILIKDLGRALRCWRIVRHFAGKELYILKPKPRRYWLKSAAVRDADEMFGWAMSSALQKPRRSKPRRD